MKKCTTFQGLLKPLTKTLIAEAVKGLGYEWAKEHRTLRNQGLKLHVEYDLELEMPVRIMPSHPTTMIAQWARVGR